MTAQTGPSVQRLVELSAIISRTTLTDGPLTMEQRTGNAAQSALMFAFARNASITGTEALDLWSRGRHLTAMPLVRMVWECGVTAQWLSQTETASEALMNEHSRQRKQLQENLTRSTLFGGVPVSVADADVERIESAFAAGGRHFEQRCKTLQGGSDLYVLYRMMCWSCHAGVDLVDEYVEARAHGGIALREEPKVDEDPAIMWPLLTVIGMMWAARAMDWLRPGRPHRSTLQSIARELAAAEHLQLTAEAWQDEQRKLHASKVKDRKGPRGT